MEKYWFPGSPNFPVGHSFGDAFSCWFFFFFFLASLLWKASEAPELLGKPEK